MNIHFKVSLFNILCVLLMSSFQLSAAEVRVYKSFSPGPGTSSFLVPAGWHSHSGFVNGNFKVSVSKKALDAAGEFSTGFELDVLPHLPELTTQTPSKYAMTVISVAMNGKQVVEPAWKRDFGDIVEFGIRLKDIKDKTILQYKLVANDKTGTLFIATFQSPEDEWENAWKDGERMLEDMKIDESV